MITWYTLERAVGQVEDRSGGGVRGERHNESGLWRVTAFGLRARQERTYSDGVIKCVWMSAPLWDRAIPQTHICADFVSVARSLYLSLLSTEDTQSCSLFSSSKSFLPHLHMHAKRASHWRRGGNRKGWKAEGERHRERSRALYKERLKGGMNEQTSE